MSNFNLNQKEQKGYLILLLLVSPFLALFNILKLKNEKEITFFGTLFFGLLGSVFFYLEGSDGHTHLMHAKEFYLSMDLSEFFVINYDILIFNARVGFNDLYLHWLSFISASILQTPELIHVFSGLMLGYFFSKSVLLVLKNNLFVKKGYVLLGLLFLFMLIKSVGAINSIRMWTGMWVFFYGTFSWSIFKKKKYIYVILFSFFIHFSYIVILIPVLISYFLREQKKILVLIFITSFFITLGFSTIQSFVPKSELMETKQDQYAIDSDEKAVRFEKDGINTKKRLSKTNFYKANGTAIYLNYNIVGLSMVLIFFYLKKKSDTNLIFLVSVGQGLYAFSNFVAFSPSLQGRTKTIAATFLLAAAIHLKLTLKNYNLSIKNTNKLNFAFGVFLLLSIPMIFMQISDFINLFSFFAFLFPQISWILGDNDFSIKDVIEYLK